MKKRDRDADHGSWFTFQKKYSLPKIINKKMIINTMVL